MFGQYTLHQKLGDGGYSTVFKCTDSLGIRYACKVLPKDKNKRVRVQQEIHLMKLLKDSPKIVRFVEAGEDDNAFYIVQELCRGGAVKDYISVHGDSYGENAVASIVRGTLRGLVHMHTLGIIHRDIKSGNIMLGDLSDDADVKLGDLGTAVLSDLDIVEVNDLVGTAFFMAPENLIHRYHVKSDIWSVGVLAYQLLSGTMPFNDKQNPYTPSLNEIWKAILLNEPNTVGRRWDTVGDDAKDFLKLCLCKEYQGRPTAVEGLQHPWLTKTDCMDRFTGTPLTCKPFMFEDIPIMNAQTLQVDI